MRFLVDAGGSDPSWCGSRSVPCKTIQPAVTRARTIGRPRVYVASGIYEETITLSAGVRIEGAWGAIGESWTPICGDTASDAVVVQAPSTAAAPGGGKTFDGAPPLSWVTTQSQTTPNTQPTPYGL